MNGMDGGSGGEGKKTPLYDCHVALGGKMVSFAGYQLPVQYSGVIEEHMAVREKAGLFDVSHMGEVIISGPDALANINRIFTNDFTSMIDGRVRYSPMCNDNGGVVDDLLIYREAADRYLVVVNASNREKDVAWMQAKLSGDAVLEDISDSIAQIALQGPLARRILEKLADKDSLPQKYYTFRAEVTVEGISCMVSQTGYTGEDGYELYCAADQAVKLWNTIMRTGEADGLIACGLGARDTLRMEAAMPLYGHEMDEETTPFEAGLGFAVKMNKVNFIGKEALSVRGEPQIRRVGLRITGRGIARENNPVLVEGRHIGRTTSGTHLPYLKGAYAMALVEQEFAGIGTVMEVEVRSRKLAAEVVPLPFYKR